MRSGASHREERSTWWADFISAAQENCLNMLFLQRDDVHLSVSELDEKGYHPFIFCWALEVAYDAHQHSYLVCTTVQDLPTYQLDGLRRGMILPDTNLDEKGFYLSSLVQRLRWPMMHTNIASWLVLRHKTLPTNNWMFWERQWSFQIQT